MTPFNLSILVLLMLARAIAFADGGAAELRKEAGTFVITVFTSPAPLSSGPVDVSLLLQNRNGLEPVLDADVSLLLRAPGSNQGFRVRPTRGQAQNKLLYAAPVTFAEAGKWQLAIAISRNGERTDTTGILDVAPAPKMASSYWGFIAFPPLMIAAYAVRERLIRRKARGW